MPDIEELTNIQKAAVVVTTIGAENASLVYKKLTDDDVEKLTYEISSLPYLDSSIVEATLNEFYELCLTQKVISEGGVEYARSVLEKAYGPEMANKLMERVSKSMQTKAFEFVRKSDYKNLLAIIQNENPQTIALVLSYVKSEQASAVLQELPKEKRVEVVERIAKMESASPEIVHSIEETLERKFAAVVSMDLTTVGGVNFVAEMFVFEDILGLDSMSIQRFIRDVETKDLAVAIKGSNAEVAAALYANMPQRMQESIQQEIEYLHNVRMRDVDEAQQRIVGIIRHLEEEGEIVIGKGGEDEIIA